MPPLYFILGLAGKLTDKRIPQATKLEAVAVNERPEKAQAVTQHPSGAENLSRTFVFV